MCGTPDLEPQRRQVVQTTDPDARREADNFLRRRRNAVGQSSRIFAPTAPSSDQIQRAVLFGQTGGGNV